MNILKTSIASSSLVFMLAAGASQTLAADDSLQTMFKGWAAESSQLISSKIKSPGPGVGNGQKTAIQMYRVTVGAEGDIQNYDLIARKGSRRFARASERALGRLGSFPKLPQDYHSDDLSFVLVMDYQASPHMTRSVWETYNSTRTKIYDVTGNRVYDDVVLLSTGAMRGR